MNSTEFAFSLENRWMATMIVEKCKGDFDTYFFVIDNFIKHANAKGYNRHVATGAMQLSELLSVGQEALGLLLLENYREPWKQLMEYMKQALVQAMLNQPRQSTQIRDRRRCLGKVREWNDTISYMKRCIRTDCRVKDRDSRLNSKIK
jgi:hypothetical protein